MIIAGCAGPALEQAKIQSATLPRALGIGATASSCFFICIVIATFTQGDVKEREAEESDVSIKARTKGMQP